MVDGFINSFCEAKIRKINQIMDGNFQKNKKNIIFAVVSL